ncbi:MAG: delta-class carbonic anhydrase [Arenicella sp.]
MHKSIIVVCVLVVGFLAACSHSDKKNDVTVGAVCENFGPQTPRDISQLKGENKVVFPTALPFSDMNLCDIHFHNAAEHKAPAFSVKAPQGGFQCGIASELTVAERAPYALNQCQGVKPGDTIEVHWVYTSCDTPPAPGLGSCLPEGLCVNPSLRVETQVFTVVNDDDAMDFAEFTDVRRSSDGYYQVKSLPEGTGEPVNFLGSTTGTSFSEQKCSPLQATWNVRPQCAKVSISSLSNWCAENEFGEDHAHGVRSLVNNLKLLSTIKK